MAIDIIDLRFHMWRVRHYINLFTCLVSFRPLRDPLGELRLSATSLYRWKSYGIKKLDNSPKVTCPGSGRVAPEPRQPETCAMLSDTMLCCCSLHCPLIWPGPVASLISSHTNNCYHQLCPFSGKNGTHVRHPRLHWCRLNLCVSTFKPCATVPIWTAGFPQMLTICWQLLGCSLCHCNLQNLSYWVISKKSSFSMFYPVVLEP